LKFAFTNPAYFAERRSVIHIVFILAAAFILEFLLALLVGSFLRRRSEFLEPGPFASSSSEFALTGKGLDTSY
jgi:hypothetical protein